MQPDDVAILALATLSSSFGFNYLFWSCIGILRLSVTTMTATHRRLFARSQDMVLPANRLSVSDVAVIIAAHNEELALPRCLRALSAVIPAAQIYVSSDGSRDRTVEIASAAGCHVLDIQPNAGKAHALKRGIEHFRLVEKYRAVLIQDADSEIDPAYFAHALPLFDDPGVAVVAGHVTSRWRPHLLPRFDMLFAAYRTRLYRVLQSVFQYGQSSSWINASYIAPGFASMYRTSVLSDIDITAPGLVIEDFNMTFEVQRKQLGRVAYTPLAHCSSEDPHRLRDYRKQVQRWYLGFWQTVLRHGVWASVFWLALGSLLTELVMVSVVLVLVPVFAVLEVATGIGMFALSPSYGTFEQVSPIDLLLVFLAVDYALTVVVVIIDRRPLLLAYGLLFPALRLLDATLFLIAFGRSFSAQSDGRWVSPQRHGAHAPTA
jgi:cellulose synthase/poly-beta-1,6-N-acetylglucosamine synthase-like glycosyltransferase